MRIALGIEYDGQAWQGWQTQPHRQTVQDVVEQALQQFAAQSTVAIQTVCAGRTDSGVHATAQVIHFDTLLERPLHAWVRGVNAYLPESIAIRWARQVPDTFHARFSALRRRYEYWLYTDAIRAPHLARRMAWYHQPLDVSSMQSAANHLLGTHDFSAFRAAECQAKTPIRTLFDCTVREYSASRPARPMQWLCFSFQADAFLQHMVRNIVGSLLYVGNGRCPVDWLAQVLQSRHRALAAPTFSSVGLYLTQVCYPAEFELPSDNFSPQPFLL